MRVKYGYQHIHVLLRGEGGQVHRKRVYRIYCEERLRLRRKRSKRRVSAAHRHGRPNIEQIDLCLSTDYVADNLVDGRRIRALTVLDNFSRECPAILVDHAMKADQVVSTMEGLRLFAGRRPQRIQVDNGSEFVSKTLDKWAYEHDFSRPGKPTDSVLIESLNDSLRHECLNTHWFLSLDDAHQKIKQWRRYYNRYRPHSPLGNSTPEEFAEVPCQSRKSILLAGAKNG